MRFTNNLEENAGHKKATKKVVYKIRQVYIHLISYLANKLL